MPGDRNPGPGGRGSVRGFIVRLPLPAQEGAAQHIGSIRVAAQDRDGQAAQRHGSNQLATPAHTAGGQICGSDGSRFSAVLVTAARLERKVRTKADPVQVADRILVSLVAHRAQHRSGRSFIGAVVESLNPFPCGVLVQHFLGPARMRRASIAPARSRPLLTKPTCSRQEYRSSRHARLV